MRSAEELQQLKEDGNAAFKRSEYVAAAALYSQVLEEDATMHVCWHNRAVCKLRLGDIEGACKDASESIQRKPDYAKAYSTKGSALLTLERYEEAKACFLKGCVVVGYLAVMNGRVGADAMQGGPATLRLRCAAMPRAPCLPIVTPP